MGIVRRILLGIIVPILSLLLFLAAFSAGLVHTFSNSASIEHIISGSGIYNSVITSSLNQASSITGEGASISFSNTVMHRAAVATFTPQFIQQNTETIIGSTYRWLNGKTPLPDFYIDLTGQKNAFATSVAQSVQQQLSSLPACTKSNAPPSFDALSATCLPVGITPSAAAASLQNDILNGQGFLDNPVITADTIKANGDSKSIFADQLKNAPQTYHDLKIMPLILMALSVLMAIAVIFLSKTRRRGVRRVGIVLLAGGVLLLFLAWGSSHIVSSHVITKISLNTAVLQDSVRTLVVDTVKSISKSWWIFGASYSALGAGMILVAIFWRKDNNKQTPPKEPAEEKPRQDQPNKSASVNENLPPSQPASKTQKRIIVQ